MAMHFQHRWHEQLTARGRGKGRGKDEETHNQTPGLKPAIAMAGVDREGCLECWSPAVQTDPP